MIGVEFFSKALSILKAIQGQVERNKIPGFQLPLLREFPYTSYFQPLSYWLKSIHPLSTLILLLLVYYMVRKHRRNSEKLIIHTDFCVQLNMYC